MNDLIHMHNGKPMVSSKELADRFNKPHKQILEVARKLIRELESDGKDFGRENFQESSYKTERGKTYSNVMMTRDGFTILGMGLQGGKALEWKLKYLSAFNKMESYISNESKDLSSQINEVSKHLDDIKSAGSAWGKTGHAIRKKKKKAINELGELISHAQLQLGF